MATAQVAKRPFHESIVDAIRHASGSELKCLATLIKSTKVPKGHDEIIEAWNERKLDDDMCVPADLLAQQQHEGEKHKGKK